VEALHGYKQMKQDYSIIQHPSWSGGNRMIAIPMTDFLRLLVCSLKKDRETYNKYSHLLKDSLKKNPNSNKDTINFINKL